MTKRTYIRKMFNQEIRGIIKTLTNSHLSGLVEVLSDEENDRRTASMPILDH